MVWTRRPVSKDFVAEGLDTLFSFSCKTGGGGGIPYEWFSYLTTAIAPSRLRTRW